MTETEEQAPKKYRPGRPPVTKRKGFSVEDLVSAYKRTKSARAAAQEFGISHNTALRYLSEAGINTSVRRTKRKHTSDLANWIRENQGIRLPRSVKKLSEMSGIPENTISCYLYRRRKVTRDIAKSLPNLLGLSVRRKDDETKELIPFYDLLDYQFEVDRWSFALIILGTTLDNKFVSFTIPKSELGEFKKTVEKAAEKA